MSAGMGMGMEMGDCVGMVRDILKNLKTKISSVITQYYDANDDCA